MPRPTTVSTKLERIAKLAKEAPDMAFTSLAHHIDLDFLVEAFRRTRKDGAPGVDGQTGADYEKDLEANLQALLSRLKSGTYRAPPVRRVHIPKDKGKTRPLGIPTFEDKVLQRAVHMILEALYEQDFRDCSYGFRPGRSAHRALQALYDGLTKMSGGWVIDADIQGFFNELDHSVLRDLLDRRVRDGVIRRVIHKWLKAGILEDGALTTPEAGTPQGGVISPLLSNVYLHEVLDTWFEDEIKPRLSGEAFLVRYADDFVIVCSQEEDARRVLEVLPKRLGKFGLTLHPEKTKLVEFQRPPRGDNLSSGRRPGSFDFLGFTQRWGKSRRGNNVIRQTTMSGRLSRAIRAVYEWCCVHRHEPVAEQHARLGRKVRGHYAYYGVTGNGRALRNYLYNVERCWQKWLNRRSHKNRMPWDRFRRLKGRYPLPQPVVVHSVFRA